MTDLRKAAEMALEAWGWDISEPRRKMFRERMEALRQALAEPEQEPVAWVLHRELFWPSEYEVISEAGDNAIPLYTAPPKREWVGLTDDEFESILKQHNEAFPFAVYQSIEAKLKEKNI